MRFHDSPWLLLRNSPEPSIVGHGLSTAETVLPQVANMAAATLQLGRGLSTAETYSRSAVNVNDQCFNWAAVFQPRKHRYGRDCRDSPARFNWAAVFQPRKPRDELHIELMDALLQLGRGLSTAETGHRNQLL